MTVTLASYIFPSFALLYPQIYLHIFPLLCILKFGAFTNFSPLFCIVFFSLEDAIVEFANSLQSPYQLVLQLMYNYMIAYLGEIIELLGLSF